MTDDVIKQVILGAPNFIVALAALIIRATMKFWFLFWLHGCD